MTRGGWLFLWITLIVGSFTGGCAGGGSPDESASPPPPTVLLEPSWVWRNTESVPDDVDFFSEVACLDELVCVASGQTDEVRGLLLRSADGGLTWTVQRHLEDVVSVWGIECLDQKHCIAWAQPLASGIDDSESPGLVFRTRDAGITWSREALEGGLRLNSVSCPSSTFCMAVGDARPDFEDVLLTSSDAKNWSPGELPQAVLRTAQNFKSFGPLYCFDERLCWLLLEDANRRQHAFVTSDLGRVWDDRPPEQFFHPSEMECFDHQRCLFGGIEGLRQTDDQGAHWRALAFPERVFWARSVTCATADACFAIGDQSTLAADGIKLGRRQLIMRIEDERTIRIEHESEEALYLDDIDCSPTHCVAVGSGDVKAMIGTPR